MGYDQPVLNAVAEADKLIKLLESDFDVQRGGFTWWHGYNLDGIALTEIMHYLYGLVSAVRENLHATAVHLADLTECRYTDDLWILTRVRANARLHRGGIDARREARIDAHTAGVLRSAGSILDTLAGVVVGVGGFDTDLMRADLGCLQPLVDGSDYPGPEVRRKLGRLSETVLDPADKQGVLLRATRSSLLCAGPTGWLNWTRLSRNDRVHRASRTKMLLMQGSVKKSSGTVARPLPRKPEHAEAHGMRTASTIDQWLLTEDALMTLAGIVDSVNAAVVGTFLACTDLWRYRQRYPNLIIQPNGQWRSTDSPRDTGFIGYKPGSITHPGDDGFMIVGPDTAHRLRATKVMDGDHPTDK